MLLCWGKNPVNDFWLPFDLGSGRQLDNFALLARQDYNLGGRGDWFGCFRGGLYGFYARLHGVTVHFHNVHVWQLNARPPIETEFHISSILFNMDSAIECFAFAINALGNAVKPEDFLDVTDEKALHRVAPWNITGRDKTPPLPGYKHYFPNLQTLWQSHRDILKTITGQHDVSKHRQTIYERGKLRGDPPQGFYEALGITKDQPGRMLFHPHEEIILLHSPKTPPSKRKAVARGDSVTLEALAESYCEFINTSCVRALEDARSKIVLAHSKFKR